MLYSIRFEKILFLDIETVPMVKQFDDLPEKLKKHWEHKFDFIKKSEEDTPESLFQRAGIYSEFGKIICISVGYLYNQEFRLKSFYGDDEKIMLNEFAEMLNRYYNQPDQLLCGHNSREFDIPYIARRMLVNGIHLPNILNVAGKKPWEVAHLDTMDLWKFGDYKHYTSLDLLTAIFDIPTPKADIDGSQVAEVYYEQNDLPRIAEYCQRDTLTVAQLLLRYLGRPLIKEENIVMV